MGILWEQYSELGGVLLGGTDGCAGRDAHSDRYRFEINFKEIL